jgi:hypothetical protein
MRCNQCNRVVRNGFKPKWRHLVNYHPEIITQRLLPLLNPVEAHNTGRVLGELMTQVVLNYARKS